MMLSLQLNKSNPKVSKHPFPAEFPFQMFRSLRNWIEHGPQAWRITTSTKQQFFLMPANTPSLRKRVYQLGYRIYSSLDYSDSKEQSVLCSCFDTLPNTLPLLVVDEADRAVATLTLVSDGSSLGLPLDAIFSAEVDSFRRRRMKTTEIMRLAIDDTLKPSKEILLHLFNFAYIYARRIEQSDGFLITVNPHHEPYYRRALHFQQIGDVKPCPKVNDAPAVLLHLCFQYAAAKVKQEAGRQSTGNAKRSLYTYLFPTEAEPFIAEFLAHRHQPMTTEEMKILGIQKDQIQNEQNRLHTLETGTSP